MSEIKNKNNTKIENDLYELVNSLFFNQNFGLKSKSEIEIKMFNYHIEECIKKGNPYDDYTLSKELGISENKIRNLKEKRRLLCSIPVNLKNELKASIINSKYNNIEKTILLMIDDVCVLKELAHYLDTKGCFYDYSLTNNKTIKISLDTLIENTRGDIDYKNIFDEKTIKTIEKDSKKEIEKIKEIISDLNKENVKQLLKILGKNGMLAVMKSLQNKTKEEIVIPTIIDLIQQI